MEEKQNKTEVKQNKMQVKKNKMEVMHTISSSIKIKKNDENIFNTA